MPKTFWGVVGTGAAIAGTVGAVIWLGNTQEADLGEDLGGQRLSVQLEDDELTVVNEQGNRVGQLFDLERQELLANGYMISPGESRLVVPVRESGGCGDATFLGVHVERANVVGDNPPRARLGDVVALPAESRDRAAGAVRNSADPAAGSLAACSSALENPATSIARRSTHEGVDTASMGVSPITQISYYMYFSGNTAYAYSDNSDDVANVTLVNVDTGKPLGSIENLGDEERTINLTVGAQTLDAEGNSCADVGTHYWTATIDELGRLQLAPFPLQMNEEQQRHAYAGAGCFNVPDPAAPACRSRAPQLTPVG